MDPTLAQCAGHPGAGWLGRCYDCHSRGNPTRPSHADTQIRCRVGRERSVAVGGYGPVVTSARETGRRLEQEIAAFFTAHGYATACNQVIEGRSGGRHEVDIVAEKSDALTTYRVAIECKAWQTPVEKDVIAKAHYVVADLGLSKAIVVSLAGCRAGAERAARELGVEIWGPDELRRHLGEAAVSALAVPASTNRVLTWTVSVSVPQSAAEQLLRTSGKGRFNLRTLETLVWMSDVWLPAYCMRLTVAQPEVKHFKTRLRSATVDNVYDALSGTYLGGVPKVTWTQTPVERRATLPTTIRDSRVHASIRKAVDAYNRVTSAAAVSRHAGNLALLGIPTPCEAVTVDQTSLVHLPYYAGILEADGRQRVVAVSGWRGTIDEAASEALTANLALVRNHFVKTDSDPGH